MSENGEKPRIPTFSTEDPLLPSVKARLLANSDRRNAIKQHFSKDLRSSEAEIVGVRSEDILTFLDCLLEGSVLVNRPGQIGIMGKEQGWFYLTPFYKHDYFNKHPKLSGAKPPKSFMETAEENARLYADKSAFAAAFARNVIPVFRDDWLSKARRMVGEVYVSDDVTHYSDSLVVESVIDLFRTEIERLKEESVLVEQALGPQHKWRIAMLQELFGLIHPSVEKLDVLKFLLEVAEKRGGVMVGFNENVFQGKIESDATESPKAIHDTSEIAIQSPTGRIDLSQSIVAIEPLGEYEDQVLRQLGLI